MVRAFVERGFNVVANSRRISESGEVRASHAIALVDGDIGEPATAGRIVETVLRDLGRSTYWSTTRGSSLISRSRSIHAKTSGC